GPERACRVERARADARTVSPRFRRRGDGLAGPCAVRTDRPRGVLPREGGIDQGGQEGLPDVRRTRRLPGLRAAERRALRHLGRSLRARAPQAQEARRLTPTLPLSP